MQFDLLLKIYLKNKFSAFFNSYKLGKLKISPVVNIENKNIFTPQTNFLDLFLFELS